MRAWECNICYTFGARYWLCEEWRGERESPDCAQKSENFGWQFRFPASKLMCHAKVGRSEGEFVFSHISLLCIPVYTFIYQPVKARFILTKTTSWSVELLCYVEKWLLQGIISGPILVQFCCQWLHIRWGIIVTKVNFPVKCWTGK